MKKFICSTTINPPTEAIQKFDAMQGWTLVVAGDLKTPQDYSLKRGIYLTPKEQEKLNPKLSDSLGWNCVERRNVALAFAYREGADVVALVDDDNIPLSNWGENLSVGIRTSVHFYQTQHAVFDPIRVTHYPHLWHRGFPLNQLMNRDYSQPVKKTLVPDIQADFWNGDPDIDAICRMEYQPKCKFEDQPFPFASNAWSPFNSQNTFISRKVLQHYFLAPGVGRISDIWAAYYVQSLGYQVVFEKASVYQARNPHDLIQDMVTEFLGYEKTPALVEALKHNSDQIKAFLPSQALLAWEAYRAYLLTTKQANC